MTAWWRSADPPPPDRGGCRYTRDAVVGAERWAWAGELRNSRAEFFYDGFEFWRQPRSGERRVVPRLSAPGEGWWHKPACSCSLCVACFSPDQTRQWVRARK